MNKKVFSIVYKDKKTKARAGILRTKKGKVETPLFMPVATKASVKHISSLDLETMGAQAIISNTFVLMLKPGEKVIKKAGGIGKFMHFSGVNVTDSGGFQMYTDRCYIGSNDKEVIFINPFTKEKILLTPEEDMRIQIDLGSDIAMCLDSMPLLHNTKQEIAEAVRKTTLWAKRCKEHHKFLHQNISHGKRQLLFGISQGGIYPDLRKKSVKEILEIGFDGYALGGLALGEPKKEEYKMIEIAKKILPEESPVYLMGAGHPVEIIEAVSRGVDMFDSRFPTQNARRGTIFTSEGKIRINNAKYVTDQNPLDPNCDCFVCKHYSKSYIRYQLQQEEGNGFRLASYHNLYYLVNLCKQIRKSIKEGTFSSYKKKILKVYAKTEKKAKENYRKYNLPKKSEH